ncbi:MAG: polyphosphate kinase 1, partial [Acidobacteriaceae bacterium]|nr:polyphosphate kinase 1 [Acidobacteriaceae bacterium]
LEEARDTRHPLLERAKFISILFSNLDEFFMVRVAGLMQKLQAGKPGDGPDSTTPITAQLEAIRAEVTSIVNEAYEYFHSELLPALGNGHIHILDYNELSEQQREQMENYFLQIVFPVLTPLAFDVGRPFPLMSNLSLNIAAVVKDGGGEHFARVKVPDTLAQLVRVSLPLHPLEDDPVKPEYVFVWLEQVIMANLKYLFPGLHIVEAHPFHITRDAEVAIQEVETDDLLETVEEAVWQRRFRDVVRIQVNARMRQQILEILSTNLELDSTDVYRVDGPIDLGRIRHLLSIDRPDLKDKPFVAYTPAALQTKPEDDLFARIRQCDVLLHHPFESFQPVIEFLRKAAHDPDVLAIKMTLYRTGRNSPIVEALVDAIENGKQVAVLVELKARFDEESNIEWARQLEQEGVHVVYGLVGLKVHAKVALVVRREGEIIRRYVHMATGNYNAATAKMYTDIGLFTADEQIAADVSDLFNYLTGYSAKSEYRKLLVAPVNLRARFLELIEREIEHQKSGMGGHMTLKMNALEDAGIITALYRASQAGVSIDLLVRGICCLRPGVPGVSENIRVISVLGRFLEHSRIFHFRNAGQEEIYLGSADMMPRNLNRRVEILFPIQDQRIVRRLRDEILATYLADTARARMMHADGTYSRANSDDGGLDSQAWFLSQTAGRP